MVQQHFARVCDELLLVAQILIVELLLDVVRHLDQALERRYHFVRDAAAGDLKHFILSL